MLLAYQIRFFLVISFSLTITSSVPASVLRLDIWDGGGTVTNWQLSGFGTWNSPATTGVSSSAFFRLPMGAAGWASFHHGPFDAWDNVADFTLVGPVNDIGVWELSIDGTPVPHPDAPLRPVDTKFNDSNEDFNFQESVPGQFSYPELLANTDYTIAVSGSGSIDFGTSSFAAIWTNGTYTVNSPGGLQYDLVVSNSGPSMGAVPEPSSLALLGLSSLGGLVLVRRRRRLLQNQPSQR